MILSNIFHLNINFIQNSSIPEFGFWFMRKSKLKLKGRDWHHWIPDYDPPQKIGADYFMIFIIKGAWTEARRVEGEGDAQ